MTQLSVNCDAGNKKNSSNSTSSGKSSHQINSERFSYQYNKVDGKSIHKACNRPYGGGDNKCWVKHPEKAPNRYTNNGKGATSLSPKDDSKKDDKKAIKKAIKANYMALSFSSSLGYKHIVNYNYSSVAIGPLSSTFKKDGFLDDSDLIRGEADLSKGSKG